MPPTVTMVPGLFSWAITLEGGATRTIAASSMRSAIGALPVTSATKGAAVTGTPATPVVSSLVPTFAKIGDANFTLHVHGTGFGPGSVILWNGSAEPTTYVSPTELTTGVNMATATTPMAIPVSVQSLLGATSNTLTFDLQPAP